jgi:3-hydroxyacyl-CoA dehydrogenase
MGLLNPTLDFGALAECDLIIEAVYENMDVKKDIFGKLDKIAKPGAILASNTQLSQHRRDRRRRPRVRRTCSACTSSRPPTS